jgi:ABC-type uncharacterized transport system substrate-binding protein
MTSAMDRRTFLMTSVAGVFAAPLAAGAQQAGNTYRIGIITFAHSPAQDSSFWERMRELGWVEGQNVMVQRRSAGEDCDRVSTLARELVHLKVGVFVLQSGLIARRVQRVTQTVPICAKSGDFQSVGLVTNLAKPEGNVTGLQLFQPDLVGKRLTLLKEVVPGLTRVGVLVGTDPLNAGRFYTGSGGHPFRSAVGEATQTLGLQVQMVPMPSPDALEGVFSALAKARVQGLMVLDTPPTESHGSQINAWTAKNRIAAIYESRAWVESGGLMSYGAVYPEAERLLASCVDKILRGVKPADVPVQQTTMFELVINLKTAKALGLTIPPSLLQRADQVIE